MMTPEIWAIVIQSAGLVVTLIVLHNQNIARMAAIETKVGLMWKVFERRFDVKAEDLQ